MILVLACDALPEREKAAILDGAIRSANFGRTVTSRPSGVFRMNTMHSFRGNDASRSIVHQRLIFLLAALALSLPVTAAYSPAVSAAATCGGKKATLSSNSKSIDGKKGHDVIQGGGADQVIDGGGGNDTICGGGGDDVLNGDKGGDRLFGEAGNDFLDGDRGSDPELDGGPGSDRVIGGSGNDKVYGGAGDGDFVQEGFGDGVADGGPGDRDVVFGDIGGDRIDGGPGDSDIASYSSITQNLNINLSSGSVSGAESERLNGIEDALGGSGDDTIRGSGEKNRLDGGPGDDTLVAVGSGDSAFGGSGSNQCQGDFTDRNACGGSGGGGGTAISLIESIDGNGSLVIDGNNNIDNVTLDFRNGAYVVQRSGGNSLSSGSGCNGNDSKVTCSGKVNQVNASLDGGNDTLRMSGLPGRADATIDGGAGSDDLTGGPGDDVITSGDDGSPDQLHGGGGDDALFGINTEHPKQDSGAAVMDGDAGNDLLIGGQPCDGDTFIGGSGDNDSASFARVKNSGTRVRAQIGGAVTDPDINGCNAGSIHTSVEKMEGSKGNDILIGDNSANSLLGMAGNDDLDGKGGFDKCSGGGGSNSLRNCEKESGD